MNPDHLLALAGQIVRIGTGAPRQATINRAISTAYDALFHALAGEYVARPVGSPRPPRYWQIVTPVHRALDHGTSGEVFERLTRDAAASQALKLIGKSFLQLRSARSAADYDPSTRYSRREALDFIAQPIARSRRSPPCRMRIA